MKLNHSILASLIFTSLAAAPPPAIADDEAIAKMRQTAIAAGDSEAGKKVFKKCRACHKVGAKAKNGVGPMLNDIVGTEIAANEGFKYSKPFFAKKKEGLVWTPEALDEFLAKPKKFIKKSKMTFPGLKKPKDRANIIAYLAGATSEK